MKQTVFIVWMLSALWAQAQTFKIDTLIHNGNRSQCINIVILGDGYTASEQMKFQIDAQSVANYIFTKSPWKEYKNYFNVLGIEVISLQSGVKHPGTSHDADCAAVPITDPNNYFGSAFDANGIHRLVYTQNTSRIYQVITTHIPDYDLMIILVNTSHYGGSGGNYIVMTAHPSSGEIAVHELGHAFAGLADEYWAGDGYAAEAPNMTQTSQPNQVRWKNWIGESQIGVYQHGTSGIPALWYRPHQDCLMRYLNQDYCRVCAETVIEKIHQLTSPLTAYAPIDSLVSLSGTFVDFTLQTIQPEPNTLRTVWELDNKKLPLDQPCTESLRLYDTGLSAGRHTLKVTLEDTTTRVRVNYHGAKHFKTVWWNVSHTNGIRAQSSNQLTCRLYPNPVSDYLFLSLSVEKPEELSVQILTMGGKTVQKMKKTLLLDHERYETMIDLSDCPSGIYWVVIQLGEMFEYQKIVKPF